MPSGLVARLCLAEHLPAKPAARPTVAPEELLLGWLLVERPNRVGNGPLRVTQPLFDRGHRALTLEAAGKCNRRDNVLYHI